MEKMDNKTIQKLRELYFKVCARLHQCNFLQNTLLPTFYVQGVGITTLTKLHTCTFGYLLEVIPVILVFPVLDRNKLAPEANAKSLLKCKQHLTLF